MAADQIEVNNLLPELSKNLSENISQDGTLDSSSEDSKSLAQILIWSALYTVVVFLGFFGNAIVIWIVAMHASMRTVTNYFLVNLSICDVMYATLNIPWYFTANIAGRWPFGSDPMFCKIVRLVAPLSASASTFSMTAISVDRYFAIVHPLSHQLSHKKAWAGLTAIWLLAILTAYPQFHFSRTVGGDADSPSDVYCLMLFPDGELFGTYFLVTKIIQTAVYMVIPGVIIACAYTSVARELWEPKTIGESQNQRQVESKKKIVKMMITIVIVFNVTMLPAHVYLIAIGIDSSLLSNHALMKHLWLGVTLLANSNSVYNPMIYCYMNGRFRRGFINFFRTLCCKQRIELESVRSNANAHRSSRQTETRKSPRTSMVPGSTFVSSTFEAPVQVNQVQCKYTGNQLTVDFNRNQTSSC